MDLNDLRPEFLHEILDFRKMIAKKVRAKRVKGKEVTPDMLVHLLKLYVEQANGQ